MSRNNKRNNVDKNGKAVNYVVRRRRFETLASVGMLLIVAGLTIPLFNLLNTGVLTACKWVFSAGSLIFFAARCVKVAPADEDVRLKRMRRMEFWAGACFIVAAFFWFYNEAKYAQELAMWGAGSLSVIRDSIVFSMAGAVLQIIASWLIYFREKKLSK